MNDNNHQQRLAVLKATTQFQRGSLTRWEFLRHCAAGIGFSNLYFLGACARSPSASPTPEQVLHTVGPESAIEPQSDQQKFLADIRKTFAGTTRHFDVTLDAILNHLGTEPHLPAWPTLSIDYAVELGKMTTGQQDIKTTLDNMAAQAIQATEQ